MLLSYHLIKTRVLCHCHNAMISCDRLDAIPHYMGSGEVHKVITAAAESDMQV